MQDMWKFVQWSHRLYYSELSSTPHNYVLSNLENINFHTYIYWKVECIIRGSMVNPCEIIHDPHQPQETKVGHYHWQELPQVSFLLRQKLFQQTRVCQSFCRSKKWYLWPLPPMIARYRNTAEKVRKKKKDLHLFIYFERMWLYAELSVLGGNMNFACHQTVTYRRLSGHCKHGDNCFKTPCQLHRSYISGPIEFAKYYFSSACDVMPSLWR